MANNFLLATNDTFGEKRIRSAVVYTEERGSVYTTAYCPERQCNRVVGN